MRVLLTGATGFLGSHLSERLRSSIEYDLRIAIRKQCTNILDGSKTVVVDDIGPDTRWQQAVQDVQIVVHTAARVHVMNDTSSDPLSEFRRVNTAGTLNLARQSAAAGVCRFIFISSIGVNGAETISEPFSERSEPIPHSPYALSKWEAEEGLRKLTDVKSMEVVVIRPPLVYGPGAPGNFNKLLHIVAKGVPLPLGAINNRRSLVAVDNLVDLIVTCIKHPAAANQTLFVSDGEDLSTTELLQRMAVALRKPVRLLPVPALFLKAVAALLGKRDLVQRLLGSLQVDISNTIEMLNWTPPVSVDEALKKTAEDYLSRVHR